MIANIAHNTEYLCSFSTQKVTPSKSANSEEVARLSCKLKVARLSCKLTCVDVLTEDTRSYMQHNSYALNIANSYKVEAA